MDAADTSIRVDSSGQAELPIPKRFWWLKRSPIFLLVPVLILAAARSCSVYLADRHFARELQSLRDRGEPVDLSAFRQAPVPASEDAAPLLRQAALAASNSYRTSKGLTVERWVGQNAKALALARDARKLSRAYWGDWPADPANQVPRSDVQLIRLQLLLSRASDLAAHRGDASAVIDYMRDSLHGARLIGQAPDPLSQEIAMAWQITVTKTLDGDSPVLVERNLADGAAIDNESLVASTRFLIEELLDPADMPDVRQLIRAIRVRTIFLMTDPRTEQEGWFYVRKPSRWEKSLLFLFRAKIRGADLQYLQYLDRLEQRAGLVSTARALENLPQVDPTHLNVLDFRFSLDGPSWAGLLFRATGTVARRRLAAIGLAVRLYQRDHQGEYPKSLNELVPKYLSEIPRDPFDPLGATLAMSDDHELYTFDKNPAGREISFGLEHPIHPIQEFGPSSLPWPTSRPGATSHTHPTSRPDDQN